MAKRKREETSLGDVIKDFINVNHLQSGLDKVSVKDAWGNVMGTPIVKYTTNIVLERDVLYVKLSSSVLRVELSCGKEKIIRMINEEMGKDLITKLVLR